MSIATTTTTTTTTLTPTVYLYHPPNSSVLKLRLLHIPMQPLTQKKNPSLPRHTTRPAETVKQYPPRQKFRNQRKSPVTLRSQPSRRMSRKGNISLLRPTVLMTLSPEHETYIHSTTSIHTYGKKISISRLTRSSLLANTIDMHTLVYPKPTQLTESTRIVIGRPYNFPMN